MTTINPVEVETKKKVGKLDGSPVIQVGLKGGLHLILVARGLGKFETLGAGPHPAVARFIAKKKTNNKVEWTELQKADFIEPEHFAHLLPYYETYTDALRAAQ
jgi:hypothetical protein